MEVDEVIAKFPGVKRSQSVGVPDELLGEMVVSCVVPADGVELSEADIVAFVKKEVASFKVPRRVLFFTDAEYALTGNEKIKTSDLRALAVKRLDREKEDAGAAQG
jgi:acyl-coenzyme A synthetase/AMP-(fatty) acid ligase